MKRFLQDGFRQDTWWSRLLFCLILAITSLSYPVSNRLAAAGGQAMVLKLPLDDLIPFMAIFIIPYCYWHLQIYATTAWLFFSRRTDRSLHRLVIMLAVSDLLAAIIFFTMPTQMLRPDVIGNDLLSRMVRLIYSIDLPYNLFPSKHVTWALILNRTWAATGPQRFWFSALNHTGTALIIASTVLVKQHYTPDILGGAVIAVFSIIAGNMIWRRLFIRPGLSADRLPL